MEYEFRLNGKNKLVLTPKNKDEERWLELVFGPEGTVKIERPPNSNEVILTKADKESES